MIDSMCIQSSGKQPKKGERIARSSYNRPSEKLDYNAKVICNIIPKSICIGILSYSTLKELTNSNQAATIVS